MMIPMELVDLIERLGSLGILCALAWWGVRWVGVRIDRMLDHNEQLIGQNAKMVEAFMAASKTFKTFESEERLTHEIILKHLATISENLAEIKKAS